MKSYFTPLAAVALATTLALPAQASIQILGWNPSDYNSSFGVAPNVAEDFEDLGPDGGEREVGFVGSAFDTGSVGTFETLGGQGTGGTVSQSSFNNTGLGLALRTGDVFGRRSTTPDSTDGWFLDSNDTGGLVWEVALANGRQFNKIVFTIMDAADQNAYMQVSDGTNDAQGTVFFDNQNNGNVKLVEVVFSDFVSSATITIENFLGVNDDRVKLNDGFSIDSIQVAAIPLPAGVLLLGLGLAGIGGARVMQKRRKA